MAEKIVSPGVFTNEIDASFLPAAIAEIGACFIGPTVKGPALTPTVVNSYAEYQEKFGDSFLSGSNYYQFLTSHAVEAYLKHAGTATIVRILDGDYSQASASVSSETTTGATYASSSLTFVHVPSGSMHTGSDAAPDEVTIGGVDFTFVSESAGLSNSATQIFVEFPAAGAATTPTTVAKALADSINASSSLHNVKVSGSGEAANLVLSGSAIGTVGNITVTTGSGGDETATTANFVKNAANDSGLNVQGGTDSTSTTTSFVLKTQGDGAIMNSVGTVGTNNISTSGSKHNVRWEISTQNTKKGTFTLLIRRGDDSQKRKQILETWNNLSLDPNSQNYIAKRVGDSVTTLAGTESDPFLQPSGSYPNKSKYVYVTSIADTVDYLDENGDLRLNSLSQSLPSVGSGSSNGGFEGGTNGFAGTTTAPGGIAGEGTMPDVWSMYESIEETNSQGLKPATANKGKTAYTKALNLIANQDEYDINAIYMPGLVQAGHNAVVTKAIDVCETRGDCFVVADPVVHGSAITDATGEAADYDSNYAAMYWPWIQIPDNQTGKNRWVPPSVGIAGVYAFNDKVAHPWFAPAGLNRGGIDTAIQAERKLTHSNRDTLYDSNVNPIATFPGEGVCVWGQKTLQKKASALDRVNVRRLMIKVKKFIASTSRYLVFEQNNAQTRNRFLNIVNPYLEQVQSNSGLNAFRVVMDDTNNTPDVVDRNILYGQIFLQPTKTAEFIVLDFTVQPTGATFPE